MGRAPQGGRREIEVTALDELKLATPEHEVKGQVSRAAEVIVKGVEDVEVLGMKPKLTLWRGGGGTVA